MTVPPRNCWSPGAQPESQLLVDRASRGAASRHQAATSAQRDLPHSERHPPMQYIRTPCTESSELPWRFAEGSAAGRSSRNKANMKKELLSRRERSLLFCSSSLCFYPALGRERFAAASPLAASYLLRGLRRTAGRASRLTLGAGSPASSSAAPPPTSTAEIANTPREKKTRKKN